MLALFFYPAQLMPHAVAVVLRQRAVETLLIDIESDQFLWHNCHPLTEQSLIYCYFSK